MSGQLFCDACPDVTRRGWGIPNDLQPVLGGMVVFSLPLACLARDLYRGNCAPRFPGPLPASAKGLAWCTTAGLRQHAERQWRGSVWRMLQDAGGPKTAGALPDPPTTLGRASIGCEPDQYTWHRWSLGPEPYQVVCDDVALTIRVLSLCTGQVYLAGRQPDYGWDHQMNAVIWLDTPGVSTAVLPVERGWGGVPVTPVRWVCVMEDCQ